MQSPEFEQLSSYWSHETFACAYDKGPTQCKEGRGMTHTSGPCDIIGHWAHAKLPTTQRTEGAPLPSSARLLMPHISSSIHTAKRRPLLSSSTATPFSSPLLKTTADYPAGRLLSTAAAPPICPLFPNVVVSTAWGAPSTTGGDGVGARAPQAAALRRAAAR